MVGTWRPMGQEMLLVCGGGASSAHSGPHLVRAGPVGAALVPEVRVEWSEIVRRMRRKDGSEPLGGCVLVGAGVQVRVRPSSGQKVLAR